MSEVINEKNEFRNKLVEIKKNAESYIVLSIFKNIDLYFDSTLTIDDFSQPEWKFYFAIAKKLIEDDRKILDDITIGLYLSENEILKSKYEEFGGYQTIASGVSFVQEENFQGYLLDIKKYNALLKLHDLGFPIMDKFENYKTMPIDKVQQILEGVLATVFSDIGVEEKVEDLSDGLWKIVEDANEGKMRGFPLSSSLLNKHMNGLTLGNIVLLSANSGIGKSYMSINQVIPNMIAFDEKLLILANEEDSVRYKREIITFVANNIIRADFEKRRFNQGEFSQEELDVLKQSVDWLEDKMKKNIINFVSFNSFSMKKAMQIIKKYNKVYGVKYFVLDTLKLDNDAHSNENTQAWLSLQQGMVSLYNLIKPSNLNVSVLCTFQLGKNSIMRRYLDQSALGISKNVADVCSVLLLVRKPIESERDGGKSELTVLTKKGKRVKLEKDKDYFIIFLGKNRFGETHRQIVLETDIGRGIIKDLGTTIIEQDY